MRHTPRPAVDVVVGAHGAGPSAAANPAGNSGSAGVPNGVTVAHRPGGVPRPQRTVVATTTCLAATASPGLCAHDGDSTDDDLTARLDAQATGQDLGSRSAFNGLTVSAVEGDTGADLDELDSDDDWHMDVFSKLFDGAPPLTTTRMSKLLWVLMLGILCVVSVMNLKKEREGSLKSEPHQEGK